MNIFKLKFKIKKRFCNFFFVKFDLIKQSAHCHPWTERAIRDSDLDYYNENDNL